jgi:DUF1009 family protein
MKRIGLVAGQGRFPHLFAKEARASGYKVIIVGIKRYTDPSLADETEHFHWIKLGELTRLINIFKKEAVHEAVLAGRIPQKVVLRDLSLDPLAFKLYRTLKDKQPQAILGTIVKEMEKHGIKLLDSVTFLSSFLPEKGTLTKRRPTPDEKADIDYGLTIAREIAALDIGQTVVVKDKAVLAIEAIEGTNEAIRRAGKFSQNGLVVVKVARPNQDMRFDIPVAGLRTIKVMKEAGASTLAIEAQKTLLLDKKEFLHLADTSSIAIVAV